MFWNMPGMALQSNRFPFAGAWNRKKLNLQRRKSMRETMEWKPLTSQYDPALADLIRASLKENHLDIPGTVYFDEGLDHLSRYYSHDGLA